MNRATQRRSCSRRAALARSTLAVSVFLAFAAGSVVADEVPEHGDLMLLPPECAPYWAVPGGKDSPAAWNQVLSFAACVQDASIARVDDIEQLPALVAGLELGLAPAVRLYVAALEYGPGPIQLRAAFQIGMTQVALLTRARASLIAPEDRATNRASAARYRKMQEELERLLDKPAKLAWMMFVVVERAYSENPSIVNDDVTRYILRTSRELELGLRMSIPIRRDESPSRPPQVASPR